MSPKYVSSRLRKCKLSREPNSSSVRSPLILPGKSLAWRAPDIPSARLETPGEFSKHSLRSPNEARRWAKNSSRAYRGQRTLCTTSVTTIPTTTSSIRESKNVHDLSGSPIPLLATTSAVIPQRRNA